MISVTRLSTGSPALSNSGLPPWVSVICISYNHRAYVGEALRSVVEQDYRYVELIVLDNGSSDGSAAYIASFAEEFPSIRFIQNPVNIGLNRAFNQGLALAGGRYIIDLSADDVLLPGRIAKQVALFEQLPDSYAVVFSNAAYIDAQGRQKGLHYATDTNGKACVPVPSGNVFRAVLASYFICTPTMMMRRDVLSVLGGYDETLAYEDFDFWVRSSRLYSYAYLDEVLTQKRQLPGSLSGQVIQPDNTLLQSTLVVCYKAFDQCATSDEYEALAERIQTFIRKAFYAGQFALALQFGQLLRKIEPADVLSRFVLILSRLQLPVNRFYRWYRNPFD